MVRAMLMMIIKWRAWRDLNPQPSDPKLSQTLISMYQQQAKFNA
jgi:hypothetical protein